MLDSANSNSASSVTIGGFKPLDAFSCRNCIAWHSKYYSSEKCKGVIERGVCAKTMLAQSLKSGAVQIHLHVNVAQTEMPWQVMEPELIGG